MDNVLKIRFVGGDIDPSKVSSKEFADIIRSYEEALLAIVEKKHPAKREAAFVSVVDVKNMSLGIAMRPNFPEEIFEAADTINTAINTNTVNKLPFKTVESLSHIQAFVYKRNCVAELNGYEEIASTKITPSTNLQINQSFYIKGHTTIYGKLMRVGGSKPRVRIEFDNGNQFSFLTKEGLARMLASHLYEKIGVRGMALWKKENNELVDIKPVGFIKLDGRPLGERMKELREMLSSYWKDVDNPDEFVSSIRS